MCFLWQAFWGPPFLVLGEVFEFVGVSDLVDGGDFSVLVVEVDGGGWGAVFEEEESEGAVEGGGAHFGEGGAGLALQAEEESGDAVGGVDVAADGERFASVVGVEDDVLGEDVEESLVVVSLDGLKEGAHEALLFFGGDGVSGVVGGDAVFGAADELSAGGFVFVEGFGEFVVAAAEYFSQEVGGALGGVEAFEEEEEGHGEGFGEFGVLCRTGGVFCDGLGEPGADVGFASHAGEAGVVDAEAGDDGGEVGAWGADGVVWRAGPAEPGFLEDVFCVGGAAEHAVGEAEEPAAFGFERGGLCVCVAVVRGVAL